MIQKVIRQSLVSLLVFVAVLFAFSRVDWMELFGLHRSIIEEKLGDVYWELFSQSETFIDDEDLTAPLDSLRTLRRPSIRCFLPSAVPTAWSATACRFIWWSATR